MKTRFGFVALPIFVVFLGLLFSGTAFAQSTGRIAGEDTMTVLGEKQGPGDIDNQIALPENASEQARQNAGAGLEKANRARERNRMQERNSVRQDRQDQINEQLRDRTQDRIRDRIHQEQAREDRMQKRDQSNR